MFSRSDSTDFHADIPHSSMEQHWYRLTFVEPEDEQVFEFVVWRRHKRQIQLTSGLLLIIMTILSFDMDPSNYEDGWILVMFFVGRLVPTIVLVGWNCLSASRFLKWWSVGASCSVFLMVGSIHTISYWCAVTPELTGSECKALDSGQVPWMSATLLALMPYLLVFALRVRWDIASVAVVCNWALFVALIVPKTDGPQPLPVVLITALNFAVAVTTAATYEKQLRATFRREVSLRRKLDSIVQSSITKMMAHEQGQRLFELLKRSSHMLAEYSADNMFVFVSPGSKVLLGYEPRELTQTDVFKTIVQGDQDRVRSEFHKLLTNPYGHLRTDFRRRRANGKYVLVELDAHVVTRPYLPNTVLGIEKEITNRDRREPATRGAATRGGYDPLYERALYTSIYEMRNPLLSLEHAARALKRMETISTNPEAMEAVSAVLYGASQARNLLAYSLGVAASRDSEMVVDPHQTDIRATVDRVVHQARFITESKIDCSVADDVPESLALDRTRLTQLLFNGLANAVEWGVKSTGKPITVKVETHKLPNNMPGVAYTISNPGATLGGANVERLFATKPPMATGDRHSVAQIVQARRTQHQRLGLSISRDLVRAMGGAPTDLSEAGGNTTYKFTLPLAVLPHGATKQVTSPGPSQGARSGPTPTASPASDSHHSTRARPHHTAGATGGQPRNAVRSAAPATQGMHVMLVDDERVNRRLGAKMLERLGCTHLLLEDGDQVIDALESTKKPFDAILMDILMRRTDGATVCRQLRDAKVNVPVVAMTGNTGVRDVQRFMASGFDLVLPKPFDIKAMSRALTEGRARRARATAASKSAEAAGATESKEAPAATAATDAGAPPEASGTPASSAPAASPAPAADASASTTSGTRTTEGAGGAATTETPAAAASTADSNTGAPDGAAKETTESSEKK